jgi:hypothetical protein
VNQCVDGLANSVQSIRETCDGTAGKLDAISKVVPISLANSRDSLA